MLPPFIIEQIRRREEEEEEEARKQNEQPRLELPLTPRPPPGVGPRRREESEDGQRGVIILEL
jgi:hypothetical protein